VATPEGRIETCSGECPGVITVELRGEQGFGYDPVFCLPELDKTMAELTLADKNKYSHRARAAAKVPPLLVRLEK
jgi:XTP/dITP diphosphohydrolase